MITFGLWAFAASLAVLVPTWVVSLVKRDASVADIAWGLAFCAIAGVLQWTFPNGGTRQQLMTVLVAVWGVRLSAYLAWRNHGKPEDSRYVAMRAKAPSTFPYVSLVTVFVLQAGLATLIALPVVAMTYWDPPPSLGPLDYAGIALWAIGLLVEVTADTQLARFKADPANKGKVMDRGLWGRSRHPNYFGEAVHWWGLGLLGVSAGAWWSLAGPALLTFLLLRVSGVSLMEKTITERRPEYADYIRRVPAFLPTGPGPRSPGPR